MKKYGSYYHCCNASNIGHMTHEERLSYLIKKGFSKMSLAIATFSILITDEFWFDFLSYIFSVSENTKIIHLIMMIWLFSFTISSYKIVSSPPKDPGGSKKILSKSRI